MERSKIERRIKHDGNYHRRKRKRKNNRIDKTICRNWAYILVATKMMAACVYTDAVHGGYNIPYPITIMEYLNGEFDKRTPILIDELDLALGSIFNLEKVEAVTLTKREYPNITYLEKPEK